MMGHTQCTPGFSVVWYLPRRSMIMTVTQQHEILVLM